MKQIIFVIALLCSIISMGQDTLSYRPCTNCPTGENTSNINTTYTYGSLTPYESVDVTSDFGARYPSPKYDWHKGIDYRPNGCLGMDGCRGTSVVSIQGGRVNRIYAAHGMKMIAIAGNGGHHYGYGHIFNSRFIGAGSNYKFINEGKFFIKAMDNLPPNQIEYAIIDLINDMAYARVEGTVTIDVGDNQRSVQVVTTVSADQDIAPLGGSCCSFYNGKGAENDALPVHLHLYQFRNIDAGNLVREAHETNCMNPLQSITHQSPSIQVKWQTQGQTAWDSPALNPKGTLPTRFRVRPLMLDVTNRVGGSVSETGKSNRYGNVVSNINKAEVEIKKATDASFKPYEGLKYDGVINLGGTSSTTLYPTYMTIDYKYGKWDRQGINAFAYDDAQGYPYDDYYFEGFFSRIKNPASIGKLTDVPQNAVYNDDIYQLRAKVTNVIGSEFYTASETITLDNFLPYITNANIRYNDELLYQIIREGNEGSSAADDGFVMNRIYEYPIGVGLLLPNELKVEITTSEPMQNIKMSYKKVGGMTMFSNPEDMTQDATDKLKWTATIPTLDSGECYDVQFEGQDLSGNEIINVYAATNQNAESTKMMIPTRKGAGAQDWNHNPTYTGKDWISFCIKDCDHKIWSGNNTSRRGGDDDCNTLSSVTSSVLYTSCIQATIVLGGAGFNPSDFTISWTDAQGNPLTQYNNLEMIEVSSAGIYCFNVEAIDDCCTIRGCAEVLPSMMEDAAFDLSADITIPVHIVRMTAR